MMSSNPNFKPCMIYAAAELPAVFENTLWHDCIPDLSYSRFLGMQSLKDCLVTKFYYFSTSEKYRMVFHFIMIESTFSAM